MRKWLLVTGIFGVVLVVIALLGRDNEPRYDGHSLSYWLDRYRRTSPDMSSTGAEEGPDPKAVEAISRIGTNALPLLLRRLRYEPSRAREALARGLNQAPGAVRPGWLADWAESPKAYFTARGAANAFAILGSAARPAIPELLRLVHDREATNTAAFARYALANIGADALPHLIALLEDTNAANRLYAAFYIGALSQLRTNAAAAVPALLNCLRDGDPKVQWTAAAALGEVGLQAEVVVPALQGAYEASADAMLRRRCIGALGGFGQRARDAEACLVAALSDPEAGVRRAAVNSLRQVAPEVLTNAVGR